MNRTMQVIRAAVVLAVVTLCGATFAANPERPPAGMGKYLVVLWEPGTPVPGKQDERMRRVAEPDVVKLGGRLLATEANRRVVFLPYAALEQVRRHEAVASVQRVWAGEPFSEWTEPAGVSGARPGSIASDSETFTWERAYTYDDDGNITHIGDDEFAYDDLGRITFAVVSGGVESYFYDAFGNLTGLSRGGTSGSPVPVDPSSNRIVGEVYDAAGNVTTRKDGGTYVYDSLNKLVEYDLPAPYFSGRRILYDANDERIGVFISESWQRWTIRDFEGQILREFRSSSPQFPWSWEQDHVRGGGQLIAGETYQWGYHSGTSAFLYGGKRHYHLDHLGSVRVVTDAGGKALAEHDFYPFGAPRTRQHQEQINYAGDPHIDGMRFAGHWRTFLGTPGVESDEYLDYMHARYYDANVGRFLSVDPSMDLKANLPNPQRWNRYSYVSNNPINKTDPDGRDEYAMNQRLLGIEDDWHGRDKYHAAGIAAAGVAVATAVVAPEAIVATAPQWMPWAIRATPVLNFLRNWGAAETGQASVRIDTRQLQAKFKHAPDFEITGNFNKANAAAFGDAIQAHVRAAGTRAIDGTYRGTQNVTFHVDAATGRMVMTDRSGNFISA